MIAVVIVTWTGWRDAVDCIRACLALTGPPVQILLCDNASPDGTADLVEQWATGALDIPPDPASPVPLPNARPTTTARIAATNATPPAQLLIIDTGANLGFAGGCNVGLHHALATGASHVLFLNPDTVIAPDALTRLLHHAAPDPHRGLTGATMHLYHAPNRLQGTAGALNLRTFSCRHLTHAAPAATPPEPPRPHELLYPIGAAMLAARAFLETIGPMNPTHFLYYEEADWALRARGRFTIAIAPMARVYHKVGVTTGSTPEGSSPAATARLYRARLICARHHAPRQLPHIYAAILSDLVRMLLRRRWGKVRGILIALMHQFHQTNTGCPPTASAADATNPPPRLSVTCTAPATFTTPLP